MDALTLLKQDHQTVEELFQRFEASGERALKAKKQVMERIIRELSVHGEIEEMFFYPACREKGGELEKMILEALEEHHVLKWTLNELQKMPAEHERFVAKATVLIETVRRHVKEEERELFKMVRQAFERDELVELGELLAQGKKMAPTRPHPRAPDEPPGKFVAGAMAKLMDTGMDLGRELISGRKTRATQASARLGRRSNKR
ncbi:MAG TPA: hemerythrin domain-containing protein [Myxococcaceae bacterium]|nr:hemerythrin domain-containing protein [Myxococcaceae bacterium]